MPSLAVLSRRSLLCGCIGAALSPIVLPESAFGQTALARGATTPAALRFPLRTAYARIGPDGFVSLRLKEQNAWSALQTRLGGLMARIEPLQPTDMLGSEAPKLDGGASCAMAARAMAETWGLDTVIVYATQDGQASSNGGWIKQCFAAIRGLGGDARASGEAHLLDVAGGPPLCSATADASPRSWLNPFDNHRNPEAETLSALTAGLERRIQTLAGPAFAAQQSIADGFQRPRD